ncbi:MAG: hypothetical protein GF401_01330 [Chitinivibrionales bacterium]|nr:hypothetical protein [Chitinivibrionales bacterium]
MPPTYSKTMPLSDVHDILLKIRSEFSAKCKLWIEQAQQREIKAKQHDIYSAAQECKAERKALADAEYTLVKMIDRELKKTIGKKRM